jgi:hypothetical protein
VRLTERDVHLLVAIDRARYMTAEQSARVVDTSPGAVANRLRTLERHELLISGTPVGAPRCWRVTPKGRELAGNGALRPASWTRGRTAHNLTVTDVLWWLARHHPTARVLTEAQLRTAVAFYTASGRRPDGVLIGPSYTIAVEVELHRKKPYEWHGHLLAYEQSTVYAANWWVCAPGVLRPLQATIASGGFRRAIAVALEDVLEPT